MSETQFSPLQSVKRRFFAMRNGVIADTMRRAGAPYRIVFGLNIPQIKEIAREFSFQANLLSDPLWENVSTRESRLLAVLLKAESGCELNEIESIIASLQPGETEVADLIVMKLIKGRAFFDQLLERLRCSSRSIDRYIVLRMAYSLVEADETRQRALALAREEIARADAATLSLARQLEYDADW